MQVNHKRVMRIGKTNAKILGFCEAPIQLALHARVELGHRLRLRSDPEIVDVFLTSETATEVHIEEISKRTRRDYYPGYP
jgi:hypothetical protein